MLTLPTITKILGGTAGKPGIYSANFNPNDDPTNKILLKAVSGSLLMQYGNVVGCDLVCSSGLWQKDCTENCDVSVWTQINLGGNSMDLPFGYIRIVSKIGIKASLSAEATPVANTNGPLTYSWTSTPALTFSAPTSQATTITAATPGQYVVSVVATAANGLTHQSVLTINLQRIIEVNGPSRDVSDHFSTLTAAVAWRNTNDPGQVYEFIIFDDTTEPGTFTNLDNAVVTWKARARSTFAGNAFVWTSVTPNFVVLRAESRRSLEEPTINAGGTTPFQLNTVNASNMRFRNILVSGTNTATVFIAQVANSSNVSMLECTFTIYTAGTTQSVCYFSNNTNLILERCSATGVAGGWFMEGNSGRMIECYGELVSPNAEAIAALMLMSHDLATRGRFDVSGGTFLATATGLTTVGAVQRCAVHFGNPVTLLHDGLTLDGVAAINRTVGGYSYAAATPNPAVAAGLRMVGCSGVGALLNITALAGTAFGQNSWIPS